MKFWKLSGAGNDFILVEKRTLRARSPRHLARRLCARRTGIGADGLLVVAPGVVPTLDYYNADGSRAFCGNGSRCAAWWMRANKYARRASFRFKTSAGIIEARVGNGDRARVTMPDATGLRRNLKLKAAGRTWTVDRLNTGVPHAVVRVAAGKLDTAPVLAAGRALRRHRAFQPQGANVNFTAVGTDGIRVRTYERGVEAETLACGSGAVAAALISALWRGRHGPIRVHTAGGEVLNVGFRRRGDNFTGVWLEGPARLIYQGEVAL